MHTRLLHDGFRGGLDEKAGGGLENCTWERKRLTGSQFLKSAPSAGGWKVCVGPPLALV